MTVTVRKEGSSSFTTRWVIRDEEGRFLLASPTTVNGGTRKSMVEYATRRGWEVVNS